MYKRISIILMIAIIVSALGCTKTGGQDGGEQSGGIDDKHYVLDYHYGSLAALGTSNSILETDNSVYYLYENMIYFSDKDYKDWLPLCVKPNCSHSDKDCDAYIEGAESGIWIYDQYIFYVDPKQKNGKINDVSYPALCRMRLDGTQHEEVMQLPAHNFDYIPVRNHWSAFFLNRYLWVSCVTFKNVLSEFPDDVYTYRVALDTFEINETMNGPGWMLSESGNDLYCLDSEYSEDENGIRQLTKYTLTVYDIETGATRKIGDLEMPEGLLFSYALGNWGIYGNRFVYLFWNNEPYAFKLYSMDIETGINTMLASADEGAKWIGLFDWKNGYLINNYMYGVEDSSEWGLYVYDLDLNEVDSYLYAGTPDETIERMFFLQTDSYVFACSGYNISYAGAMPEWYIDKADIGTGNLTWKRWAPEE